MKNFFWWKFISDTINIEEHSLLKIHNFIWQRDINHPSKHTAWLIASDKETSIIPPNTRLDWLHMTKRHQLSLQTHDLINCIWQRDINHHSKLLLSFISQILIIKRKCFQMLTVLSHTDIYFQQKMFFNG